VFVLVFDMFAVQAVHNQNHSQPDVS